MPDDRIDTDKMIPDTLAYIYVHWMVELVGANDRNRVILGARWEWAREAVCV